MEGQESRRGARWPGGALTQRAGEWGPSDLPTVTGGMGEGPALLRLRSPPTPTLAAGNHGASGKVSVSHSLSGGRVCATPWTVAHQAPVSMGFSRQEHWSGLPFSPPSCLPDPGIEPRSLALLLDSLPSEPCDQQSTNPFRHFYPP